LKERLLDILEKLPVVPLLFVYAGYLGYEYYTFTQDAASPLQLKQVERTKASDEVRSAQTKILQLESFAKNLDQKRSEVRGLATKLDEMKAVLTEDLDIPEFIKLVVTEAKRVGLTVVSIRPTEQKQYEFYGEQAFELAFKGVYVQLLVYLERLSSIERIIRVDDFDVKATGSSTSAYVELAGKIQIKTYRYRASSADALVKEPGKAAAAPTGAPAAPAGQGAGT
jgi:type IV pilus assembly protein PilO